MSLRRLSAREMEVARLIADGYTNKQIVATLGISKQRVSQIVNHIAELWELDCARDIRIQIATRLVA